MQTGGAASKYVILRLVSIGLLAMVAFVIVDTTHQIRIERDYIESVNTASLNENATTSSLPPLPHRTSPDVLIAKAEALIATTQGSEPEAARLMEDAISLNEFRPFAWALLAHLYTEIDGRFSDRAEDALTKSLAQCLLCDRNLIKWRLEFVISHWPEASEKTRLKVFEGADFLRWWYLDMEYLNDLSARAERSGVLFREYQRRIDTPVRPHEVGR